MKLSESERKNKFLVILDVTICLLFLLRSIRNFHEGFWGKSGKVNISYQLTCIIHTRCLVFFKTLYL